jgi:DNA mismatch repair protein MutS
MSQPTTPLMEQYKSIKNQYPDALLLFRVGDFYETFGEDAVLASKVLGIVLTKRAHGVAAAVPLAGFPHHALDSYLPKLVKAGYRVAVCDQLEDPKVAKGIVKRGITELVTPGLSFHDAVLDQRHNNYLASLYFDNDLIGIAFLDVSTGEFLTAQGSAAYIDKLLQSFQAAEVIINKKQQALFQQFTTTLYPCYMLEAWIYQLAYARETLSSHFGTVSVKGFGIDTLPLGIIASGAILRYLEETAHKQIKHITSLGRIEEDKYVWLDKFTIRNLEILQPQQEGGVALLEVLDKTVTPMGARLLKKWLILPLKDLQAIQKRLDIVEVFFKDAILGQNILKSLKSMGDLERLISKVSVGRALPKDLLSLQKALQHIAPIQQYLQASQHEALVKLAQQLYNCTYLDERIQKTLQDIPSLLASQGNLVRHGVDPELDRLRQITHESKAYLLTLQQQEIKNTGISSLKIAYNKIFGYYLEVTHAHKAKVPPTWIRKQTLVNAERYVTEALKGYEESILDAEEKMVAIEERIYRELVDSAVEFVPQILQNAKLLAQLDCYLAFAEEARKHHYIKPTMHAGTTLHICGGRHPVIEQQLPVGTPYVPSDIMLDTATQQIMIITGPNMSGKSALLRQVALTVLLAQIGSFVPASQADIGLVDKIFTRVGASDNLAMGESTFMMEMTETASIMNNLSEHSLIVMDEIGRGTSTYDGISIAWAIVEYLHKHTKYHPKTLFATHYQELNQLEAQFERVKNFNLAVREVGGKIIFLRKLVAGGSEHSFGIHVAQLAGMPPQVVARAHEVLAQLERDKKYEQAKTSLQNLPSSRLQADLAAPNSQLVQVRTILKQMDIDALAPIEALLKLRELRDLVYQGEQEKG